MTSGLAIGVVLSMHTRATMERFGAEALIASATARMSPGDVESVGAASKAIGDAMRSAPLPDAVRDEVGKRYAELAEEVGLDRPPVAVR